ncbi:hypothetical protein CEE45_05230 [Candidatus Heimdallarchaeota archaeon B3_Heim]|nr:MAG: hypothetical protein CEE45_05230 [Candidatus Heimdallarchaeota archaeon B3_Heim]
MRKPQKATRSIFFANLGNDPKNQLSKIAKIGITDVVRKFTDLSKIPEGNYLIVMKRWSGNSFDGVPIANARYPLGGGYILLCDQNCIVIDPGINFFQAFQEMGFKPADIDVILITHNHLDHRKDLTRISSAFLRSFNASKKHKSIIPKKITLYLNNNTRVTLSAALDHINAEILEPVNDFANLRGDFIKFKPVAVDHPQEVTHPDFQNEPSYGFIFKIQVPKDLILGITGDTRYFEDLEEEFKSVSVLATHIGSIDQSNNHLKLEGVLKLANSLKRLTHLIMTEYDYDEFHLENNRVKTTDFIKSELKKKSVRVISGDVSLRMNLNNRKVFVPCSICNKSMLNNFLYCVNKCKKPIWFDIKNIVEKEEVDEFGQGIHYSVK